LTPVVIAAPERAFEYKAESILKLDRAERQETTTTPDGELADEEVPD